MRHDPERIAALYRSISMTLEDSTTYQMILEKGVAKGLSQGISQGLSQGLSQGVSQGLSLGLSAGRTQEARRLLQVQGNRKFGRSPQAEEALQGIDDRERLERMAERIFDAADWDDLLSTP
jgi:predicted transposase YdaD